MFNVIESFISKEEQNYIEDYVQDPKFPYRFHKIHIYGDERDYDPKLQLTHHLYMHEEDKVSPHFDIIMPVFGKLFNMYGGIQLVRAKVNCTTPDPTVAAYKPQPAHTDLKYDDGTDFPHMVCLYYINDSDGPTFFYTEQGRISHRINPKKGTAIIFDGSIMRAGSNPVNYPYRFALNINFTKGS
jgi:hypothetical protein